VDQYRVREGGGQPVGGLLAAVGGAVVHDPEHPLRAGVGLLTHDLGDQGHERVDAIARLGAAEHLRAVDIEAAR